MKLFSLKPFVVDNKTADFIKNTKRELDDFFKFQPQEPLLFFLENRAEMDLIWGTKTEKWFVGAMKNNNIYLFSPLTFARESSHPKEKFWQTLKHEYCHYYYTKLTGSHYPSWLNEGLASYISGKKMTLNDENKNNLLNFFDYFNKMDKNAYVISQYWVEYLIQNFGKEKFYDLLKLIQINITKQKFKKIFFDVYGFQFNKKVFKVFINS